LVVEQHLTVVFSFSQPTEIKILAIKVVSLIIRK
jgi:hypothetical protein